MASHSSDYVLVLGKLGVKNLVKDILRRKISTLARVPIDLIWWQCIKEMAVKCVVHDPNHVISEITKTPALMAPVPLGSSQANLASAFTLALASFISVKQRPTQPIKQQFSVIKLTNEFFSEDEIGPFYKPAVPAKPQFLRLTVQAPLTSADVSGEADVAGKPSFFSSMNVSYSKSSTGKRGAR